MPVNECRCGYAKVYHNDGWLKGCVLCHCYRYDELFNSEGEVETEMVGTPTCPSCGFIDQDWWDCTSLKHDDDTEETECGQCKQPYTITMHVEYTFTTVSGPTDEEKTERKAKQNVEHEESMVRQAAYRAKKSAEGEKCFRPTCPGCGNDIDDKEVGRFIDFERIEKGSVFTWKCECGEEIETTIESLGSYRKRAGDEVAPPSIYNTTSRLVS